MSKQKKIKWQFESLGENTEKYISLSVPINKVLENNLQLHTK